MLVNATTTRLAPSTTASVCISIFMKISESLQCLTLATHLLCIWISSNVNDALSCMKQHMVSLILADDDVSVRVIARVFINMMNHSLRRQRITKSALCDANMSLVAIRSLVSLTKHRQMVALRRAVLVLPSWALLNFFRDSADWTSYRDCGHAVHPPLMNDVVRPDWKTQSSIGPFHFTTEVLA